MQIYLDKKFWQFFSARISFILFLVLFFQIDGQSQLYFHRYDTIDVYKSGNQLTMPWFGGLNSAQFSTIDLDYDGNEDLVVFERTDDKILTFINNGLPNTVSYNYAYEYEHKFPKVLSWMLLKDYNGDGKKDIFSKCVYVGAPRLHKNIGDVWTGVKFEEKLEIVNAYHGDPSLPFNPSSYYNLYVSPADMPAIEDIDHDGDLDFISWGQLNGLAYFKNMSQERYGNSDSLDFLYKNTCWGHAYEVNATLTHFTLKLFDTCTQYAYNPENGQTGSRHVGGTVLLVDQNNDEVYDVIIGDAGYPNMVSAINGGSAPNTNSSFISQDTNFPAYNVPLNLKELPAAFYEDIDNDSIKDLIVSPFEIFETENINSVWYYKNLGTNTLPNFSYVQNDFLQEQTIDVGMSSMGTAFDYDKDGLLDMVISSKGYFDRVLNNYKSELTLYKNTGTINQPVFEFVGNDYQGLSVLNLGKDLYPHFADIDADGDMDMVLGNDSGRIHLFVDTSTGSNPTTFSLLERNVKDNLGTTIRAGYQSKPQLFDYDGDNDLDLIIGERGGIVHYYENIGDSVNYSFQFVTDTMGDVFIYSPEDSGNTVITEGLTTPFFFREQGVLYMITGSYYGEAYLYGNIDTTNPFQPFTLIDTVIKNNEVGKDLTTTAFDIDNSGKIDLLTGNRRGGVTWFYPGRSTVGINENQKRPELELNIYPNPANNELTIQVNYLQTGILEGLLYDGTGKLITTFTVNQTKTRLNLNSYRKGVYYLSLSNKNYFKMERLIKL